MIKGTNFIKKGNKAINDDLRKEYVLASKDISFVKLCTKLKSNDELLMKYTSKLEQTVCELKNCSKCKGISDCSNDVLAHVYYPVNKKDFIEFIYRPCKYYQEENNS